MEITHECVVALTWTMLDSVGEVLDERSDPIEFLVGDGDLLEKIDESLQGHRAGAELDVYLEPEQAFGDYDAKLVFLEERRRFPPGIEEGMTLEGLPEGCSADAPAGLIYTLTEIYPDHVVVDGNHPLAGIALRLKLKVAAVRAASADEISAGSAGAGFFRLLPIAPRSSSLH